MTAALPLSRRARHIREFARIGFVNIAAFRLRYYTGILTYLINVSVYFFIWKALYAADADFARGFNFGEMITYVAVGWVIRSVYFNNIDQNMATDIQQGKIAAEMLKPVDIQTIYIGRVVGEAAFRLIMLTAPASLVIALIYRRWIQAPASWEAAGLFLVALVGSVLLVAALNFIIGTFAVRMKSILGLLRAKFYIQELLSGLLVPVTMFPPFAQQLMEYLPFQHIAYTPLRVYLGKLAGTEAVVAVAVQWAWVGVLLLVGTLFWRWMSRSITIQGG